MTTLMMSSMVIMMMMIFMTSSKGGDRTTFIIVVDAADTAEVDNTTEILDLSSIPTAGKNISSTPSSDVIEVDMGRMVMQLRSAIDSDTVELQNKMQTLTTKYLNAYFKSYYKTFVPPPPPSQSASQEGATNIEMNVGKDSDTTTNVTTVAESTALDDYFEFVNLAVGSFGVHGWYMDDAVAGSFISTLEFAGNVVFGYDPAPSQGLIKTLMRNAFQGANEHLYIEHLLKSDLEFLQQLTHIIIELDGNAVVETALDDSKMIDEVVETIEQGPTSATASNATTSASTATDVDAQDDDSEDNKWVVHEYWAEILLYVAAGCIGLVGLLCVVSLLRCCCYSGLGDKKPIIIDEAVVKTITVPTNPNVDGSAASIAVSRKSARGRYTNNGGKKARKSSSSSTSTTSSLYRRSTYPVPQYDDSLLDQLERAPPSPDRSITSQDSSLFTYTDNMSISKASVRSISSRVSIGSASRFSIDMPSIDLGAWQNAGRNTIPTGHAPFGHDISAIGKRDLSLIQEESNDEELVRRTDSMGSNSNNENDGIHSSSRRTQKGLKNEFTDISLQSDSGDVIADLRNLSIQIKRQARKSTMEP
jgi:hypothetical protein